MTSPNMTPEHVNAQLLDILATMERTRLNMDSFIASSHKRLTSALDRIDMMGDILEQTVSLLKIKETVKDREFMHNMINMVAACRKYSSEEREHMKRQQNIVGELK